MKTGTPCGCALLILFCLVLAQLQVACDQSAAGRGQAAQTGGNLLANGGFEQPGSNGLPEGWSLMPNRNGRGEARLDTEHVYSGKYSLRLAPNKHNTDEGFGVFTYLNPADLKGKEITISGRAMMAGLGSSGAGLLLKTDRDDWIIFPESVQNQFVEFRKTLQLGPQFSQAYLFFIVGGKTGAAWLDDLSVTSEGAAKGAAAAKPLTPTTGAYANRINTPGWQDSAFITPDGKELYFAYMPYTNKDHRDILFGRIKPDSLKIKGPIRKGSDSALEFETFKSVRSAGGTWGPPERVYVKDVNSFFAAKLSFDGKQMYYVIRDYRGGYGSGDIYVSERLGDNLWGPPQNLGPNINSDANEETPCVSADGGTLYFARNRGDGLGFELMFSKKVNGRWGKAGKMPYPINERNPSRTANHQPFLTADGKDLYFTRIQQIYRSSIQPDGSWSTPAKVFPNLPLSGHASLTADGQYIYFLSVKDQQSMNRENWTIWYCRRRPDGLWRTPTPVD